MSQFTDVLSPLQMASDLLVSKELSVEPVGPFEIAAEVLDGFAPFNIFVMWRPEQQSIMFNCTISNPIPAEKVHDIEELLIQLNARMWVGHFEIAPEDGLVGFRYNLLLHGVGYPTLEQLDEIYETAVSECNRIYPALQFIIIEGRKAKDAALAAMVETMGEA